MSFHLAGDFTALPFFATQLEKDLTMKNERKQTTIYILVITLFVFTTFFIFILIFGKASSGHIGSEKKSGRFREYLRTHGGQFLGSAFVIFAVIALIIYFSLSLYATNGDAILLQKYLDLCPWAALPLEHPLNGVFLLIVVGSLMIIVGLSLVNFKPFREFVISFRGMKPLEK